MKKLTFIFHDELKNAVSLGQYLATERTTEEAFINYQKNVLENREEKSPFYSSNQYQNRYSLISTIKGLIEPMPEILRKPTSAEIDKVLDNEEILN